MHYSTVVHLFWSPACSSAVLRASSLTQGHCLLVEADCCLRQLQGLSLLCVSLWRPVRHRGAHVTGASWQHMRKYAVASTQL